MKMQDEILFDETHYDKFLEREIAAGEFFKDFFCEVALMVSTETREGLR